MPEALCGERLRILSTKITDLRWRKAELTAQLDDTRDGYDDLDIAEQRSELGASSLASVTRTLYPDVLLGVFETCR
jgi:hypothetical protein